MDKDAFYFPHFSNARHDRKIRRLRKELGLEGYGIYFMLLEVLRDQKDFKYPMQDIDLLAEEFNTSEQKIRVVICNYQLFMVDDKEMFFSSKLVEFLQPYLKMKEQRSIAGKASGEARKKKSEQKQLNGCSTDVQREANGDEQRKVKESKVKEIKEIKDVVVDSFINNTPEELNQPRSPQQEPWKYYENTYLNINSTITDEMEKFNKVGITDDLIRRMIDESCMDNDKKGWKWIRKALQDLVTRKIFTVEQWDESERERQQKPKQESIYKDMTGYTP